MDRIPWKKFQKIIDKYQGDYHVTNLKTTVLFRVLVFAQLTRKVSLRDTIFTLNMMEPKLYHMGLRTVSRNNISNALRQRNCQIFADMGYLLIDEARKIYQKESYDHGLNEPVFAFDSTTIDLCLSVFPWAKFRSEKGGIKVHTLVNTATLIPEYIHITNANMHDVKAMDALPLQKGSWYVMDRAYLDFKRLHRFHEAGTKFVTRVKKTTKLKRQRSRKVDKTTGVRYDQIVRISGKISARRYPEKLRKIKFYDQENGRRLMFLTNDFDQPAETIAALYKRRWQVELFFKWMKQNLHVKKFFGQNENAIRIQIWVAICTYTLLLILKHENESNVRVSQMLHFFATVPFEEMPLKRAFDAIPYKIENQECVKQLFLPGF